MRFFHILPLSAWEPYIAEYPLSPDFLNLTKFKKSQRRSKTMSVKTYILNVYNTMTGEFELVQVTK